MRLNLGHATHRNSLATDSIEFFVRNALNCGVLVPAAEAQIQRLVQRGGLSERDRSLLAILRDAIQDGCIQRDATLIHTNIQF